MKGKLTYYFAPQVGHLYLKGFSAHTSHKDIEKLSCLGEEKASENKQKMMKKIVGTSLLRLHKYSLDAPSFFSTEVPAFKKPTKPSNKLVSPYRTWKKPSPPLIEPISPPKTPVQLLKRGLYVIAPPRGLKYQLGKNAEFVVGYGNSLKFKVSGPLGSVNFHTGGVAPVTHPNETKKHKLFFGLKRDAKTFLANFKNATYGVTNGFYIRLVLRGVGYRSWVIDNGLYLDLGNNHLLVYKIPSSVVVRSKKGRIMVFGCDRKEVGRVAADIRGLRVPDPYKGKGILYHGEEIRLKQGKQR